MRFLKNSFVLSEFFIWQNIWSSKRQSHCVPEHKLLFGSWFVAVEFVHQANKIRWTFFMVMRSFFSNGTVRRIFKFSCIFRKKTNAKYSLNTNKRWKNTKTSGIKAMEKSKQSNSLVKMHKANAKGSWFFAVVVFLQINPTSAAFYPVDMFFFRLWRLVIVYKMELFAS